VTTAWWNDIWLNEAFATWMEQKLIAEWKPEWNTRVEDVASKLFAEQQDSLVSARKIRQEITKKDDISDAFDGITYQKGAAVIGMFESYLGPAEFRKGVQSYLKQYAFRNATAPEFLDAISSASNKNITKAFSTFLNQGGVPVVSASLDCRRETPLLHLEQQRSLPLGTNTDLPQTWEIPVCIRYPSGNGTERSCTLMDQPKQDIALAAKACPAWVQLNDKAVGYYQVAYQGDLFHKLVSDDAAGSLSTPERVDFMGNVRSGVAAGRLQLTDELRLVELFHADADRHVVESAIAIALQRAPASPLPKQWVPANLETNYLHFVETNFGPRARQIGWLPKADEPDDIRLLRPNLVGAVAMFGGDRELAQQGRGLAEKWLQDHSSVDPNLVSVVLQTAAYYGDKTLLDRYLAELKKTTDRQARQNLEVAMLVFRDPSAISQAMQAVLAGDVPLLEGGYLLIYGGQISNATSKMAFEFVKAHYDEILAKRPTGGGFDFAALLPRSGSSFCDAQSKQELKDFFDPKVDKLLGARHALNETLEGIDVCIATRAVQSESLEAFLRKY
jgi:alanyl aminopeptidase